MWYKRIFSKVILAAGIFLLFVVIKYQASIREFSAFNFEKLKIYVDNFFYETSGPEPKRHMPLSLLERETELKLYVGEPFLSFNHKDWTQFWRLIYGAFPKEDAGKVGLPKKMRQLTFDEIAFELMRLYPQSFAYFQESHWKSFLGIAIRK